MPVPPTVPFHAAPHPPFRLPRAALLAGVFLLGLAGCFAADQAVYDFLHAHYNYNTRPVPGYLKLPTRYLKSAENWGENFYVAGVVFVMWQLDRRRRGRVVVLLAAVLLATAAVEVVKRSTGRQRPDLAHGRTVFAGPAHRWDRLGDAHSFPSGHTASAAAFSGTLAVFYPPLRPALGALMVGCGACRVWKERHFCSDVWAGTWLGVLAGVFLAGGRRLAPWRDALDRRLAPRTPSPPAAHDDRLRRAG